MRVLYDLLMQPLFPCAAADLESCCSLGSAQPLDSPDARDSQRRFGLCCSIFARYSLRAMVFVSAERYVGFATISVDFLPEVFGSQAACLRVPNSFCFFVSDQHVQSWHRY